MLVNLTDVFTNEGQVQELAASYDADTFGQFVLTPKFADFGKNGGLP